MSLEILEKVKSFIIRLVKDEAFRTQLMSDKIDEAIKVMEEGGYNFSQEEFETASIQILELKELGQFDDLSEEELVGAFGGLTSSNVVQPLYGVVVSPPEGGVKPPIHWIPRPRPKPFPQPQPLYGIVVGSPVQASYGVVVPPEVQ
ncbi:Nif11-like leader peptide family natural product precursor [Nostoc sp. KVJ3]|uniref:Nif11-like leader peptide family RiPP precursor n=1 Tax=Nostoc sp. KVJ3 TaxID=457945 RepID=UPI002237CA44|nr:Nif11-like leader peptide family RiPP precursor [Nostoc sp. KVJ3]MCW5315415.1 Nif11-like leader peptide family natural product precursor [Nostoc sp. KVJ3]